MNPPGPGTAEMADFRLGAAFHLDGLSIPQRLLLLTADDPAAPVFITPEGGRVPLPTTAGPQLRRQLDDYREDRGRLLAELERTLLESCQLDTETAARRIGSLAADQAPAFAELARSAESLRRGIREILPTARAVAAEYPAPLAERLAAYQSRKQELFRELHSSLFQTNPPPARQLDHAGSVEVAASAFSSAQQEKLLALKKERAGLQEALAEHRRSLGSQSDRKTIDNLLEEFERARRNEELNQLHRSYREALLHPDLSLAERRLLLNHALQALRLPLPSGEPIRQP